MSTIPPTSNHGTEVLLRVKLGKLLDAKDLEKLGRRAKKEGSLDAAVVSTLKKGLRVVESPTYESGSKSKPRRPAK